MHRDTQSASAPLSGVLSADRPMGATEFQSIPHAAYMRVPSASCAACGHKVPPSMPKVYTVDGWKRYCTACALKAPRPQED